jgi:hypothetical protein
MNWLLVILISSSPVKTDMVFSDLNSCMKKETEIRKIYTERVNEYIKWNESMKISEKEKKENLKFVMSQMNSGTCIPTVSPVTVK